MYTESISEIKNRIASKETFVLNITAQWCPDCTEKQIIHLAEFEKHLASGKLDLINLMVQRDKRIFLSEEHENLVEALGGHGYPRTVLYVNGKAIDTANVEFITSTQLEELASRFLSKL